ncbi:hypothetical protein EC12741_0440 [Escherichia coli 1.2741]|nr:hypothetical protein EC12741_0440 [Escherichia coli 1.2741]
MFTPSTPGVWAPLMKRDPRRFSQPFWLCYQTQQPLNP